ncbi:MAG: Rne/Rng family ribonuclease [Negativicutes bacterium]|nr:Rne/Rng family ribonuclease [Negativicutes bacterium]
MAKTILVNIMPEETRMALLEDGKLAEVMVERADSGHIVGNIYMGKIQNVLPGMQAAFVDIGREKNGFLYTGDLTDENRTAGGAGFTVGREIAVQVVKDAIGTKGPRLTTHLALPGRYVVLMPTVEFSGVSRRIEAESERVRLREVADRVRPKGMGIIIRTIADGKSEEELRKDIVYLVNLWNGLEARAKRVNAPLLLYRDVDLVIRLVRDYLSVDVEKFVVDNREAYNRVRDLLQFISPDLAARLELHDNPDDLFTCYGIDDELEKLQERQVFLKCGGHVVIDRTEALTVIDVNTGRFVGRTALGDTVFQTNLEAAAEVARQLRLRDIGGIIIIDFIDMDKEEHQQAVLATLTEEFKKDRTKTTVLGITRLGLVEMTRKKVRQDLESVLYGKCPCCDGRGLVRSPETVAIAVRRELRKLSKSQPAGGRLVIQVHPRVAEELRRQGELERLAKELSRQLVVEGLPTMHGEAYSILRGKE